MAILDEFNNAQDLDRWELLNAYLDGETTAVEEQQVEQWLQEDPAYGDLYQRLMTLSDGCHHLPEPPPNSGVSHGELCQGVFAAIDHQEHQRWWWWGAAALVGALSTFGFLMPRSLSPQLAQQEVNPPEASARVAISPPPLASPSHNDDKLNITIHQSVIEIPKAPVARPVNVRSLEY